MNAAVHVHLDEGTNVLVFHSTLVLVVAALTVAIKDGDILKITLSALVTDGTVERVVYQEKLHDALLCLFGLLGLGLDLK